MQPEMEQAKTDDISDFDEDFGEKAYLVCDLLISLHLLSANHTSDGGGLAGLWLGAAVGLLPMDNLYSFFQNLWLNS